MTLHWTRTLGISLLIALGVWKAVGHYRSVLDKLSDLDRQRKLAADERDQVRRQMNEQTVELDSTRKTTTEQDARLQQLAQQHAQALEQNRVLSTRLDQSAARLARVEQEKSRLERSVEEANKAIKARDAQLLALDPYVGRADDVLETDALDLLQSLNTEMQQTAALIADGFEFSSDGMRADMRSEAMISACEHAGDMVGNRLLELLLKTKHDEDAILVQLALQACMGVYALWIVSSWHFELMGEESFLEKIYDSMRRRETQTVSARWRALTHRHIQSSMQPPDQFVDHLVEDIANLLTLAGCTNDASHLRDAVSSRFSPELKIILDKALQLKRAIRVSVTSCDLDVVSVAPDIEYNPVSMDDEFAEGVEVRSEGTDHVLCGTDLGLERSVKVDEETFERKVLRKPKVVRESTIRAMLTDRQQD